MNFEHTLIEFGIVFAVALAVSAVVTLLWSLVVRGAGMIDWETSFRFAIIFGILAAWLERRRSKGK